jgi:hypothetical protein
MKVTFTFARQFFVLLSFVLPGFSQAQLNSVLDANNFKAVVGGKGLLFYSDSAYNPQRLLAEVPKGGGSSAFILSTLAMSGINTQGLHRYSAFSFVTERNSCYSGPIAVLYDSLYDKLYSRNFKVTRQQVDQHRAQAVPVTNISDAIRLWPGKGNPHIFLECGVEITRNLAPFTDVNGNNIYDPANGDYPAFCGDHAVFFVYNNERGSRFYTTSSNSMGIEIRALAEEFVLPTEPMDKNPVNNAICVHYELENRSAESYSDFYVAMKGDPDLGCYTNDAVGCDTNRNLAYGYNRVLFDNDCQGLTGYRNLKIAAGLKLLNRRLSSFNMAKPNMLFEDNNSDSTYYYYTLRGMWADGQPYTVGGYGRGGTVPTKYVFPGTPTDTSAWSEVSANTQTGDRWMYASSGPELFTPGEVKAMDYVFFASYDSTATNLTIVDTLRRDADIVQAFYNNTIVPCRAEISTAIGDINNRLLQVMVYPNPASSQLVVQAPEVITMLQLTNLLGQVVFTAPGNSTKQVVDVSGMPKGIYLLKIKAGLKEAVKKVVVE